MECENCGSSMEAIVTELPFKTDLHTIVIVKELPVEQCEGCGEYSLEDSVMAYVDKILSQVKPEAELEIIRYAA